MPIRQSGRTISTGAAGSAALISAMAAWSHSSSSIHMAGDGSADFRSAWMRDSIVDRLPVSLRSMVTGSYQGTVRTIPGSQPSIGSNVFVQYGCQVVSQFSSIRPFLASPYMASDSSRDQWMRNRPTKRRACALPSRWNARSGLYRALRGSPSFSHCVRFTPPRCRTLRSGNAFSTPSKSVYTTGTPMSTPFRENLVRHAQHTRRFRP